jgi:hypothetical protein
MTMPFLSGPAGAIPRQGAHDAHSALTVTDFLVLALLALAPLVNVLSPSTLMPPPMIIALLLCLWLTITRNFRLDGTYLAFIILCLVSFLPWIFSGDFISTKTLLHSVGLIMSITVYYAATRCALSQLLSRRGAEDVLRVFYFSLLFTSAFIIIEFLGINGRIPDVTPFVPYTQVRQFDALVFRIVHRPRGFATEPGVMALYYDLALFVVLPLLSHGWRWRLGYYFIILPAYLILFSTASITSTGIALVLLTMWNFRRRFWTTSGKIGAFFCVIALALILGGLPLRKMVGDQVILRVATLVMGSGADSSANERRSRLKEVQNVIYSYPLGIGFGIAAGMPDKGGKYRGIELSSGQVSLLGTFLVGGGIPAGILAGVIVVVTLIRALHIPRFGPYIAAGGLAITIHQLLVILCIDKRISGSKSPAASFILGKLSVGGVIKLGGIRYVKLSGLTDAVSG